MIPTVILWLQIPLDLFTKVKAMLSEKGPARRRRGLAPFSDRFLLAGFVLDKLRELLSQHIPSSAFLPPVSQR